MYNIHLYQISKKKHKGYLRYDLVLHRLNLRLQNNKQTDTAQINANQKCTN